MITQNLDVRETVREQWLRHKKLEHNNRLRPHSIRSQKPSQIALPACYFIDGARQIAFATPAAPHSAASSLVGLADIMRGATDPNETLGAQQLKAQFGGGRLRKRQSAVQRWIRDHMRLKAEIIAEHFEPEKLAEITGFHGCRARSPSWIQTLACHRWGPMGSL